MFISKNSCHYISLQIVNIFLLCLVLFFLLIDSLPVFDFLVEILIVITVILSILNLIISSKTNRYVIDNSDEDRYLKAIDFRYFEAKRFAQFGYWDFDLRDRSIFWSDIVYRIFDVKAGSFNLNFDEVLQLVHPEDRDSVISTINHATKERTEFLIEHRIILKNGETKYIIEKGKAYYNRFGTPVRIIGSILDNTAQKETELTLKTHKEVLKKRNEEYELINCELQETIEELKRAINKADESDFLKTAFLANLSHEIRTPMNAIVGFSRMLENEFITDEKKKDYAQIISQSSEYLLHIINDLLDISMIESGNIKFVETQGSLSNTIENIISFFRSKNESTLNKPISILFNNTLNQNHDFIATDFTRLTQVLNNLIDNAYKYTKSGSIIVKAKLDLNDYILISVTDTGIGIPKDKQTIIFDRFRQANEDKFSRDYSGTGLGLSIAKGIVELMNGKLWVDSDLGMGSTFYFTIPIQKISHKRYLNQPPIINTTSWSNKTILLVEDYHANVLVFKEYLEDKQVNMIHASDGTTALQLFQNHQEIDLILMDLRLPDINGFDLVRKIKSVRKDIVIIAQTASVTEEDRLRSFKVGCSDFISKPIAREKLIEVLRKYLD